MDRKANNRRSNPPPSAAFFKSDHASPTTICPDALRDGQVGLERRRRQKNARRNKSTVSGDERKAQALWGEKRGGYAVRAVFDWVDWLGLGVVGLAAIVAVVAAVWLWPRGPDEDRG